MPSESASDASPRFAHERREPARQRDGADHRRPRPVEAGALERLAQHAPVEARRCARPARAPRAARRARQHLLGRRRAVHHRLRDAGEALDAARERPLGAHERVEGLVQLAAADEHGARPRSARRGRRRSRWSRCRAPTNSAPATGCGRADHGPADRIRAGGPDGMGRSRPPRALSLGWMPRSATVFACSRVRPREPEVARPLPGLRRVEHDGGGEAGAAAPRRARRPRRRAARSSRCRSVEVEAPSGGAADDRDRRVRRVLGGGLVPGSLVLIGGAPGHRQVDDHHGGARATCRPPGRKVLYVSGEESAAQVRLRAERLGPHALGVPIVAETDLDAVLATLEAGAAGRVRRRLRAGSLRPGADRRARVGVGQVREVAGRLMRVAKERGIATLLVGHVTKEGSLAGPRVLEHLVDCVLSFEGERERTYRTLRALKNRFGSTNEVGVFEMHEQRAGRGRGRVGALRERGHQGARLGRALRDGGLAPAAGRGPGAGRAERARAAAPRGQRGGPQPARARARRARPPHRHRARHEPTSSSPSPAASAWTSRAPTSRSRSRSRAPAKGIAPAADKPHRGLRRARPDRRAAPRGARRPAHRRGPQVRPRQGNPSDGPCHQSEAGAGGTRRHRGNGLRGRLNPCITR